MGDRRGPPPPTRPIDHDYYAPPPPPPRDGYDRYPDYRSDRRVPPPPHPHAVRSPPRYDARDEPYPPPPPRGHGDDYDEYARGPPPSLPPLDGRGKRRRSLSPGPPPRRDYDPYPPRDDYRAGPPPPSYRGDYPPPPRPLSPPPSAYHRGNPGPPPPSSSSGYYRGPPPPVPSHKEIEAPHHLPYVVTHRYFADWFQSTNPPALSESSDALELAWKKYLAEYMRKSLRPHFDELKHHKWFEDKYASTTTGGTEGGEPARVQRSLEAKKGRVEEWCRAIENREWDNITNQFDEGDSTAKTKNGDAPTDEKDQKRVEPSLGDGLIAVGSEKVLIPSRPHRIVIDTIPATVAYSDLSAIFAPLEGFVRLSTADGEPSRGWARTGWATFESDETATKALESLSEAAVGDYKLAVSKQAEPTEKLIRATPSVMSTPDRLRRDLEKVTSIVEYLERGQAEGIEHKGSDVIRRLKETWDRQVEEKRERPEEHEKAEIELVRKTLDHYLDYLRFAFHTCYYCVTTCDSAEVLESVCPRHVRRTGPALPSDVGFAKAFDEKVPLLDDHAKLDLRDFGAELREETLFSLCSPYVKNEEEGKFRCKECNKLFSARKFVEKHIVTKHGQYVNEALAQAQYFNNYILDPAHHPLAEFQTTNALPSLAPPASSSTSTPSLADRIGGRRRNGSISDANGTGGGKRQKRDGPPPPPPKGAVLDPRAARVPSSYADLDSTPGGAPDVVELPY